jgi:hypothetical protein
VHWSIWLNLAACAVNIGIGIGTILRSRRYHRELYRIHAQAHEQLVASVMPAISVCLLLADDPSVPAPLRVMAKTAIPEGFTITTITKTPLSPSDARWVH